MKPIDSREELEALAARLADVSCIALDCEGNGWHAYRARLCVLQLGWRNVDGRDLDGRDLDGRDLDGRDPERGGDVAVAIVDPLAVDLAPLAPLFGAEGPVKVLHDLGFDARLLADAGLPLGNVRDTAIAAQLCGEPKSGLATLLDLRLGVTLEKALQDHDWGRRPLGEAELAYLGADVRHLLALDDWFASEAARLDIAEEIAIECAFKLESALAPPPPPPPPHERIKGWRELAPQQARALAHLAEARERLAEAADVPPFRVARSELLLELARRGHSDEARVARACGRRGGAEHAPVWARAIERAREPAAEPPLRPAPPPKREPPRALRRALTAWRQGEAAARAVSPQVVLPGRCLDAVALAIAASADDAGLATALAAVPGLGERRIGRYLSAWAALRAP